MSKHGLIYFLLSKTDWSKFGENKGVVRGKRK